MRQVRVESGVEKVCGVTDGRLVLVGDKKLDGRWVTVGGVWCFKERIFALSVTRSHLIFVWRGRLRMIPAGS